MRFILPKDMKARKKREREREKNENQGKQYKHVLFWHAQTPIDEWKEFFSLIIIKETPK